MIRNIQVTRDLLVELLGRVRLEDRQVRKVTQFRDLLEKVLMLDPSKRLSLNEALRHPFIVEKM